MDTYVFVYGTLRRGEINDLARAAARAGLPAPEYAGVASVTGRLYDFGDWPGLLPDADGVPVTGDVYRIDPALLPVMDAIEEYDPAGGSCFVRRPIRLTVDGRALDCYYYPIDPAHIGDAVRTDATDWVRHRLGRGPR
ncbi:gamma-glutamylcyclotransferase [Bordetella genomosp. 8]|uniref:Gamma-glutamylcyclotransferase n=1 Tax=Bordetella genomosp. 8 TaxID=1416806 RepID=A0A1W6YIW1_9BORD|nr:gamma-glutamylcyclotransferase family protein [Bordetella genomosp. 8]ARP80968.1 gamma-glutamylcyclotransferase [Bordetella genomosp. 8]